MGQILLDLAIKLDIAKKDDSIGGLLKRYG